MKRLRAFFESIAFAGLKPAGQKAEPKKTRWLGPLSGALDRFLSGPAPNDPLYLTNRSFGQKMKSWSIIAVPCLILVAGVGVVLSNILEPPASKPVKELSAKELAAKVLPNIDAGLKLEQNTDIEVVEVRIDHNGPTRLTGVVRNATTHDIPAAHIVVDLTDANGTQVGCVEARVETIPASKTKDFAVAIAQSKAAFALVREVGPTQ